MTTTQALVSTIYPDGYYNSIDITGLLGDGASPVFDTVLVQRNNPDGSIVTIRNGDNVLTNGVDELVIIDYEAPLNVNISYTITSIRHNIDGSTTTETVTSGAYQVPIFTDTFDDGLVSRWASISNAQIRLGTGGYVGSAHSMFVNSVTTGTYSLSTVSSFPVVAGNSYEFHCWMNTVFSPPAFSMNIIWLNGSGGTISTSTVVATPPIGGTLWTKKTLSDVAPAGAVNAKIGFSSASVGNTVQIFIDTVYFGPVTAVPQAVLLPFDTETVLVKSLANPSLSMEIILSSMDAPQYPVRQQINPIVGAKYPVVISDIIGARTGNFTFLTETLDDRTAFLQLFEQGATLLFQANSDQDSGDGYEDLYFMPGSITENRPGVVSRNPVRTWSVPYTEVASPAGALTSIPNNSWLIVTGFGTWQSVKDTRTTWLDVLNNPFGS